MAEIPGCSYTLFSGDALAPPVMTGWAPGSVAAQWFVETIMSYDTTVFRGVVRDLGAASAKVCARSRKPGEFVWLPAPATPPTSTAAIDGG